jgi:hypothetical protein
MFAKVFASIFDSTINEQPPHVFKVWIALLTFAQDGDGIVDMTAKAIANRTELPVESVEDALRILSEPDPQSRCAEHEGRRILRIPGRAYGWQIVTFAHYRNMKRTEDRREYMRGYMRDQRAGGKPRVNSRKQSLGRLADTETETETEKKKTRLRGEWEPKQGTRDWAATRYPRVSFDAEVAKFRDWHIGKGSMWVDWDRSLMMWIRRAAEDLTPTTTPQRSKAPSQLVTSLMGNES